MLPCRMTAQSPKVLMSVLESRCGCTRPLLAKSARVPGFQIVEETHADRAAHRQRGRAPSDAGHKAPRSMSVHCALARDHAAKRTLARLERALGVVPNERVSLRLGRGNLRSKRDSQHLAWPVAGALGQWIVHRFRLTRSDDVCSLLRGVSLLLELPTVLNTRQTTPRSQTLSPSFPHSFQPGYPTTCAKPRWFLMNRRDLRLIVITGCAKEAMWRSTKNRVQSRKPWKCIGSINLSPATCQTMPVF